MIRASDLRIGNLYRGASRGNIEIATGQTIAQIEEGKLNALPIELTPEILVAAGFDKSPTNGFYVNNAMWLETTPFVTPIYCDGTGFRRYIGKHIKYVHQLQNLYHSLTGEELKIELPTTGKE